MVNHAELLEIFPTAKDEYILPRLKELHRLIPLKERSIQAQIKATAKLEDAWFLREMIKAFDLPELLAMKDEARRLSRYLPTPKKQSSKGVGAAQVDRAKAYPILDLAEHYLGALKRNGATYRALCPFHQEKTPSLCLYPRGNDFHCFGCSAHGDVIALTQKLLSCGFIEAVKHLAPTYEQC